MLGKSSKVKRRRKHGFFKRKLQGGGTISRRRSKGRARLIYKKHSK